MEEIYEDEPVILNNNQKQIPIQSLINSESIDNSKLNPDNAFEVFIIFYSIYIIMKINGQYKSDICNSN